jgi:hypothetical protein
MSEGNQTDLEQDPTSAGKIVGNSGEPLEIASRPALGGGCGLSSMSRDRDFARRLCKKTLQKDFAKKGGRP